MSGGKNTFGHNLVKNAGWLDAVSNIFGAMVGSVYKIPGTRPLKNLLHGTWPLHHPFHPAITDWTIGGYSAMVAVDVLYLVTGERGLLRAADFLLIASFLTSLISIVSGLTDWNETVGDERRTGMLHGLLMVLATLGFVGSLVLRIQGTLDVRATAIGLSAVAWLVMLVSSYLGGELVFGFGTEVNRQAWSEIPDGWQTLDVEAKSLTDRVPVVAKTAEGVDLFVASLDGKLLVIGNTCTHAGGPLNEGKWVGAKRCEIECPWHASRFCVEDGSVHGGPATFAEPTWETRLGASGALEVRSRD
jgi:nitrite reductase/ring-hydroxylating ferredoxin subunit/uncharacterized membrane protein